MTNAHEAPGADRAQSSVPGLVDVAWVAGLVATIVVVWDLHVVRTGTTLSPMAAGDGFGYFLPAYVYEAERVRHGGFPFWNPYQGAGVPFLATLQAGALYPARLLMLLASPARAMGWSALGHALLGLVATYALCRRLGTSAAAAATAALVFTTAFALPSITAPTILEPGVWLPVVALATVAIVWGGGWAWVVLLGLATAMPPLAGGYQMTLYTVYGAAVFALAAALDRHGRARLGPRVVWRLAVAALLALATAAPQLLTTLAWSGETVRRTKPLTDMQMMPLFTESARWLRMEGFFLRTTPAQLGYFSIPVVALAVVGFARTRALGVVLGTAALVTMVLSLVAPESALFGVYKAIPGFAMFRFPLRLLVLSSLLVGVLAALGLTALARIPALAPPRRRALVGVAALAGVAVLCVWPFRNEYVMPWNHDSALARPDPSFFPGATRPPAAARVSVPGDRMDIRLGAFVRQGTLQQVRVLQDYEPLSSRRLGDFLAAVWGLPPPRADAFPLFTGSVIVVEWIARPDLLDLVAVRAILAPAEAISTLGVRGWTEVARHGDLVTYRNDRALPRAYVVERARFAGDETAALDAVRQLDFDPRSEVMLVGAPTADEERAVASGSAAPLAAAPIAVDDAERVVVDVDVSRPSVLVLADAFAPGWEAAVDGRWRRLWQANHLVRAVVVRPGDRQVEFRYHAPGFALGVALFAVTWTVALIALAVGRVRDRPRAVAPS
jgi:hypothetical protein